MKKRLLSILLTVCMVLTLLPATVLAANSTETSVTVTGFTLADLQAGIDSAVSQNISTVNAGNITIVDTANATLDLKGRTVVLDNGKNEGNNIYMRNSTLTVKDSGTGGSIEVPGYQTLNTASDGSGTTYYTGYNIFLLYDSSKLTIESGTFKSACGQFISCWDSDVIISGGNFICTGDLNVFDYKRAITVYSHYSGSGTTPKSPHTSTLTMTGGTISQEKSSDTQGLYGIVAYDGATVTLGKSDGTGPSISVGRNPLLTELSQYFESTDSYDPVNGSFTVYGGTYESTAASITAGTTEHSGRPSAALAAMNGGDYTISGGTFTSAGSYAVLSSLQPNKDQTTTIAVPAAARAAVTISGGSFKGASGIYSSTKNDSQTDDNTLSISSGKFSAKPDAGNIADGCVAVGNTGSDKTTYPYLVTEKAQPITIAQLQTLINNATGSSITVTSTVEATTASDTLDLKGKTVTLGRDTEGNDCIILVPEEKGLTVTGNGTLISNEDGGTLASDPNNYIEDQLFDVEYGGKLTIMNGTYKSAFAGFINAFGADITIYDCAFTSTAGFDKYDYGSLISLNVGGGYNSYTRRGSTLTMKAGSLNEQNPDSAHGMFGIIAYDGSAVTLGNDADKTGPSITVGRIPLMTQMSPYHKDTDTVNGTFTIYGGTYKSTMAQQRDSDYLCSALSIFSGGDYTISGGTFESACQPAISAVLQTASDTKGGTIAIPATARANIVISGGNFKGATGADAVKSTKNAAQTADNIISISGGKYSSAPDNTWIAANYKTTDNTDSDKTTYPYMVDSDYQPVDITFNDAASKPYTGEQYYMVTEIGLPKLYYQGIELTGDNSTGGCEYYLGDQAYHDLNQIEVTTPGTYTVSVEYTGTYTKDGANTPLKGSKSATFTVTPAALTITGVTAANRAYNGTKTVDLAGGALSGIKTNEDNNNAQDVVTLDASKAAGTVADAGAGTGKAVTVTGYALSGKDAANYTLEQPTGLTVDITPAAWSGTIADQSLSYKYTATGTQTAAFPAGLPADKGTTSYAIGTFVNDSGVLSGTPTVDAQTGAITLTLAGKTSYTANQTATIPVTVTMQNYDPITVNFVVTLTDKDVPQVTANNITVTYTGSPVPVTEITGTASVPGAWNWKSTAPETVADGGKQYTVVFTPSDSNTYATVEKNITVTISQAAPAVSDFTIALPTAAVYDGTAKTAAITAKTGKTDGAVTVKYNGSTTAPVNAGTYNVTFDVEASANYSRANGLSAGSFTIGKANVASADFNITLPSNAVYDGYAKSAAITANSGKTDGTITVKYNGSTAAPVNAGTYTVTLDVAAGANYAAATGLSAGSFTIGKAAPAAGDFTVSLPTGTVYDGAAKTAAITAKTGKTDGVVTVKYNGNATAPVNAGTYAVTFDVAEDANFLAVADLAAGTFTIAKKAVTVAPKSIFITTGGTVPEFGLNFTGLVGSDKLSGIAAPTFALTGSDGKAITAEEAAKTAGTYTITWSNKPENANAITGAENYNVTLSATGTLTVSAPAPAGGGASADTVTVPASSDAGSVSVDAKVDGDAATVAPTDAQIAAVASSTKETGTVQIDLTSLKVDTAILPEKLVSAAQKADAGAGLAVILPTGRVELDKTALSAVAGKGDMELSVKVVPTSDLTPAQKTVLGNQKDSALVVDVKMLTDGKETTSFAGGQLTIRVPYTLKSGEDASRLIVWHLKADGTLEPHAASYDAKTGTVTFTTTHLSRYFIASFPFTDVAESSYCYTAVSWAAGSGITEGKTATTFDPYASCTRAQVVTFLWRAMGSPEPAGTANPFTDVSSDAYYYKAVLWAVEKGVTKGTTNTTFDPGATVTRAQAVTFQYRAAGSPGAAAANPFSDVASGAYYTDAVLWAVNSGVTKGTSATAFSPAQTCTRDQIVTFLWRQFGI
jgi:hypothetical protein